MIDFQVIATALRADVANIRSAMRRCGSGWTAEHRATHEAQIVAAETCINTLTAIDVQNEPTDDQCREALAALTTMCRIGSGCGC